MDSLKDPDNIPSLCEAIPDNSSSPWTSHRVINTLLNVIFILFLREATCPAQLDCKFLLENCPAPLSQPTKPSTRHGTQLSPQKILADTLISPFFFISPCALLRNGAWGSVQKFSFLFGNVLVKSGYTIS